MVKPHRTLLLSLACAAFVAGMLHTGSAGAAAPAEIRSTVPARLTLPQDRGTVAINTDTRKTITGKAELQFDLAAVPAAARLSSCALRVVVAEDLEDDGGSGVVVQLRAKVPPATEASTVAALTVPPGTTRNTALVFRDALCKALHPGGQVLLQLEANTRSAYLSIYGHIFDPGQDNPLVKPEQKLRFTPSLAPRLMLTYLVDDALPGSADWSQLRHDAQHSARSRGRLYDPDGAYSPRGFAAPVEQAVPAGAAGLAFRQSPFLYGDLLWTVVREKTADFSIRGYQRSGGSYRSSPVLRQPKFLAAGGQGSAYYATANAIVAFPATGLGLTSASIPENSIIDIARFDPTPVIVSGDAGDAFKGGGEEIVLDAPTVASDGTLYVVTDRFIRAYAPPPNQRELWRFPTYTDKNAIGPVALSDDEATAYVLTGGDVNSIKAFDAATGDCRWEQKLNAAIVRGENMGMPIPVVAGRNVLVPNSFPTGDKLFVVRDGPAPAAVEASEMVPVLTGCAAAAALGGSETISSPTAMPAPAIGVGNEAFYLKSGQLCWARMPKEGACTAIEGDECPAAEIGKITLLIGDSSGGMALLPGDNGQAANATHLYGLDPGRAGPPETSPQLFALSVRWQPLRANCVKSTLPGLGPNLILAPDGTLYNYTRNETIQPIVPTGLAAVAKDLELSTALLENNKDGTIRAEGTIRLQPGSRLAAGTDIRLVAGERIVFAEGFRVASGARLRARAGF